MSHLFADWVPYAQLNLLLTLLIRSSLLLLVTALLLRLFGHRASADVRATVRVVAMASLLLLPLCSRFAPTWRIALLPATTGGGMERTPLPASPFAASSAPSSATAPTAAPSTEMSNAPATIGAASSGTPYRVPVLLYLWAIGTLGYTVWLLFGRVRLTTLASLCPVVPSGPVVALVRELAASVGVRGDVIVRRAPVDPSGAITPMTWGWRRPTLLLPNDVLESWPEERLRAVLLHELAHIARRDWLTQVCLQLICALYWFNPLVWRTVAGWERDAELACDDRVLLAGMAAQDYAAHLLEVVRSLRALHPVVAQGNAHTMAAPRSNVQTRLIAILEERRNRRPTTLPARVAAVSLAALMLVPIAAMQLTSQAQTAPSSKADPDTLLMNATERSWRGEWSAAAKLAGQTLQQQGLDDSTRGSAHWLLFEAAWWQGDSETENREYTLYKQIADKHPDNKILQANLQIADSYRSSANPKTQTTANLLLIVEQLIQSGSYADGLHYAKYLLGRAEVPQETRVRALLAAYRGAHYWSYEDSQAGLEKQFKSEVVALPEASRKSFEAQMAAAKTEKTAASRRVEGPLNLDFANALEGWGNDNPQHDADKLYEIGIDSKGRLPNKPSAFLTSKAGDPAHYGTLMQNFVPTKFRGKRVRYSAYLKTEDVAHGAGLWIVVIGAKNNNHAWNMTAKPIRGTTDWKKVEWVFDAPNDARYFSFGIDLTGKGKVWVDDFRFEIVDKKISVSPETE